MKTPVVQLLALALATATFQASGQTLIDPNPLKVLESRIEGLVNIGEFLGVTKSNNLGRIIHANNYFPFFTPDYQGNDLFGDLLGGDYFKLVAFDENLNRLAELGSNHLSTDSAEPQYLYHFDADGNNIQLLGSGINMELDSQGYTEFRIVLDTNLSVQHSTWFDLPIENINLYYGATTNADGNIILMGGKQLAPGSLENERFVCEFTPDGEMLRYKGGFFPTNNGGNLLLGIQQFPSGHYLVQPNHILNEDFTEVMELDLHLVTCTSMELIDSSHFLIAGAGVNLINNNQTSVNFETLVQVDNAGVIDTIYYHDFPEMLTSVTRPGIRTLAMLDTNHIYFASSRYGTFRFTNNYALIHSLNMRGEVNWAYFFGGDASYKPLDIIILPDGGCMLTVWKLFGNLSFGISPYSDIMYVVFDIDGNVRDIVSANGALIDADSLLRKALLFPNPSDGELHVAFAGPTPTGTLLRVYGMDGRLLLEQQLTDGQPVDLAMLPKGIYTCQLLDASGKLLQADQVVLGE